VAVLIGAVVEVGEIVEELVQAARAIGHYNQHRAA
jgi:hypothetical protein